MGDKNLRMEVFASDRQIPEKEFHIYKLKTKLVDENATKIIRSVCAKLKNVNRTIGMEDFLQMCQRKKYSICLGKVQQ